MVETNPYIVWRYNKYLSGIKTSVKSSFQHSKGTLMHAVFCEIKAMFLTSYMDSGDFSGGYQIKLQNVKARYN